MDDKEKIIFYESKLWQSGKKYVVGIDEAGRGPLAGPVVAAAVVFPKGISPFIFRDSKKLSEKQRKALFFEIFEKAVSVGVGFADSIEIDEINILNATKLAMMRAVESLSVKPDFAITDAVFLLPFGKNQLNLVKGDEKSLSCAAASIVAKVTRDFIMESIHEVFPEYNFKKHKGYPTKEHIILLRENGASPVHRRSFGRVRECKFRGRRGKDCFPISTQERLLYFEEKFQELLRRN
ncbi:ribonuclease HII [Desulfurobacterium sp.]